MAGYPFRGMKNFSKEGLTTGGRLSIMAYNKKIRQTCDEEK
jgi:hypothetical protein